MPHRHHQHQETGNIRVAFFLNLVFTVIELVGGVMTNSISILSDAMHDLGDSLSLGMAWYFQKLSNKKRDRRFSYGYGRFSLLGALVNSFVLLLGSVFILSETIPRLMAPEPVDSTGMMLLSVLGIAFNGAAAWRLKQGHSQNERVVSLHLMEDVLGWVAILIGSIIMHFYDVPIIDPLLSLLIAGYILYNVYGNLKSALATFLQNIPEDIDIQAIEGDLLGMEGILGLHDLHIWSMDGEFHVLTAHLVIARDLSDEQRHDLKHSIRQWLVSQHIPHATLELEVEGDDCGMEC